MANGRRGRRRHPRAGGRRNGSVSGTSFSLATALATVDGGDQALTMEEITQRKLELEHHLQAFGGTLRDDSRYAFKYITGATRDDETAETVAADMAVVQSLHSDTGYTRTVQDDMRTVARWAKQEYPSLSWTDVWSIVRESVPLGSQLEALLQTSE